MLEPRRAPKAALCSVAVCFEILRRFLTGTFGARLEPLPFRNIAKKYFEDFDIPNYFYRNVSIRTGLSRVKGVAFRRGSWTAQDLSLIHI